MDSARRGGNPERSEGEDPPDSHPSRDPSHTGRPLPGRSRTREGSAIGTAKGAETDKSPHDKRERDPKNNPQSRVWRTRLRRGVLELCARGTMRAPNSEEHRREKGRA